MYLAGQGQLLHLTRSQHQVQREAQSRQASAAVYRRKFRTAASRPYDGKLYGMIHGKEDDLRWICEVPLIILMRHEYASSAIDLTASSAWNVLLKYMRDNLVVFSDLGDALAS